MKPSAAPAPPSLGRCLAAGLASGAVAAIVGALISLPLRSPDDAFFNSATVMAGCLLVGMAGGAYWRSLQSRRASGLLFIGGMAAAFGISALAFWAVENLSEASLQRTVSFAVPLSAIAFGGVTALAPVLARRALPLAWMAPAATAAALAVGVGLAWQGDAESGKLSLASLPRLETTNPSRQIQDISGAFVIASEESTATYSVREKLVALPLPSMAVGRTSAITGEIRLDGRPSHVVVDLRTLQSDQTRRDNFIRTRGGLPSDRYPFADFTATELPPIPKDLQPGQTITGTVSGLMKIREVERPFAFQVEATISGDTLHIHGAADFTWADFQIPPPNVANLVQVEDNIHIEVLLVAKRQPTS